MAKDRPSVKPKKVQSSAKKTKKPRQSSSSIKRSTSGTGGLRSGNNPRLKWALLVVAVAGIFGTMTVIRSFAASANQTFVTEMYQRCYNKMITSGSGFNYWVGRLDNNENKNAVWSAFVAEVAKNSAGKEVCQYPYPPVASINSTTTNTSIMESKRQPPPVKEKDVMKEAESRLKLSDALVDNSNKDHVTIKALAAKQVVSDKDLATIQSLQKNTVEWLRMNGNLINDIRSYFNATGAVKSRLDTILAKIESNQTVIATNSANNAPEVEKATTNNANAKKLFSTVDNSYAPGQCGGNLPPCYVMMRESKGDIKIWNGGCYAPYPGFSGRTPCRNGQSSASGKWQFVRGTWANYDGYLNAADAPERSQDNKARELWNNGRGCSHWNAC